jgi:hypothetical protein
MALTRLIGDKHGLWNDYQTVIAGVDRSIQLGDFGIGFANDYWHDRVNDTIGNTGHRFIRGNHDNPEKCKEMLSWIPDGTVENDVMMIGGAWSIDADYRTPGHNWWAAEELSDSALATLHDVYVSVRPRVMLTHDCPSLAAYYMFIRSGLRIYNNDRTLRLTRTGEAFQKMFEAHQPEQWYFGHWHNTVRMQIDKTVFQCLDELHYLDVDI